jgi:hypothetical protein
MGLMLAPIDHPQCQKVRMFQRTVGQNGYKQQCCEVTEDFDQRGLGIPEDARVVIVVPYPKGDALEFMIEHRDLPATLTMHQLPTVEPRWDGDRFLGWEVLGK